MTELKQFKLPDVGEGLTEADIVKWHVQPGDKVTINQVIVEIETAKAVVELPSPFAGVVTELHTAEGTTVDVGTPIVSIDVGDGAGGAAAAAPAEAAESDERTDAAALPAAEGVAGTGEAAPEGEKRQAVLVGYGVKLGRTFRRPRRATPSGPPGSGAPAVEPVAEAPAAEPVTEVAPAAAPAEAPPTARPVAPVNGGQRAEGATAATRALAKPPVRKLAKDLGVDLNSLTGSGPQGSITRDDVQQAALAPAGAGEPAGRLADLEVVEEFEGEFEAGRVDEDEQERVPIRGVRKHTAAAVTASAFTAPHVTEFLQVDVTAMTEALARMRKLREFADVPVRPLLLVARALIIAIDRHPMINSSWDEEAQEIVIHHYVNLGIAAATERGLVVPNIKGAHDMSLPDLARELSELAQTARAGKTTPDDMRGGTITITNVGVFGVDSGTPILTPGEAAILAVGRIRDAPWVYKGQLAVRKVTTLALSFDHRIVDGDLGSAVLRDVGEMLEDPIRMLAWA
ncbi:MAG TPA: dihydrolipoamide acetyltransferase family protein [Streptosporangiaceae bacterium]|nr:dihydrolipoamide acetyltransferase family protein [Streptosporangiaceae bacterium]